MTLRRSILIALCAFAALAPGASAATFADFDVPTGSSGVGNTSGPNGIVMGSDGNLWFVEKQTSKIGKVVPTDPPQITDFDGPSGANGPEYITAGPDGHLWYAAGNVVVEFDPADPGGADAYNGLGVISPKGIATGPDNNLWIVDPGANNVKRVTTSGALFGSNVDIGSQCNGRDITRGPDDNMYVACFGSAEIMKIPPGNAPTAEPFDLDSGITPVNIAPGPDGRLWFGAQQSNLGAITTGGNSVIYQGKGVDVSDPVTGPDGAIWFTQVQSHNIGRATATGVTTEFQSMARSTDPDGAFTRYITNGPNNTLWFTEEFGNRIGRITDIDLGGGSGGGGSSVVAADKSAPGVSGLGMTDRTVVVGKGATPRTGRAAAKTGTTIRYTLSEAARVTLRFERKLKGRRVKRKKKRVCAKPTRKNRKKRRCTRYKRAGTLTRTSKQGRNSVKFTGRIGRKALKRGRYRLVLQATDVAGNKSRRRTLSFRVVKPPKARRKQR